MLDLYEKGINQKDFEAAAKNFGPRYIQHNPRAADGPEGFKAFIGFLKAKFPDYHSEIKKVFADGDLRHPARPQRAETGRARRGDRRYLPAGKRQSGRALGRAAGNS